MSVAFALLFAGCLDLLESGSDEEEGEAPVREAVADWVDAWNE